MKAITVGEAQGQLGQLVDKACNGEIIVLTKGDKKVTLYPHPILDLDEDSPELEAELLKAADGPFTPMRKEELHDALNKIAQRATKEIKAKRRQ